MQSRVEKFSRAIGYTPSWELCKQSLFITTAFGVASVVAKFFIPNIQMKSHLSFGAVQSAAFISLWYNKKIEILKKKIEQGDPLRKDIINVALFLLFTAAPIIVARAIHNWFFEPLSYKQSCGRGVYNGAAGLIILYGYGDYKWRKQT